MGFLLWLRTSPPLPRQSADMDPPEFLRYGRQMIVPEIGLAGQLKLKAAKVLVVGAGGLGSPAISYLAGAGVGTLGIVDPDVVEISNLHRQTIHATAEPGTPKAESAARFVAALNPLVAVEAHVAALTSENSLRIAEKYDIILDCTDSPQSRYLINDTAVLLNKPLVSASALKSEGQLAVYNFQDGPCYRCLFPQPPPPETITACGDGGIIGPVVGIMGVMQAIETIKIIAWQDYEFEPSLTLFSAFSFPPWRTMRIRRRQKACNVCGDNPQVTKETLSSGQIDYSAWCGTAIVEPLPEHLRIAARDFARDVAEDTSAGALVDVRPKTQFDMCHLQNAVNVPLADLKKAKTLSDLKLPQTVVAVCRYGNDSQTAVRLFAELGAEAKDIKGGLAAWTHEVDPLFPLY